MINVFRWSIYFIGIMIFSMGITITVNMQHLGIHPWDVLNVALFDLVGLSIGSWTIIISIVLIVISWTLDKSYIKIGTFLNAVLVGAFVDFYMWLDFLPKAAGSWTDIVSIVAGIVIMGLGGGIYNSAGVGSGPRDGFMLSISDKTGASIGKVRIITESAVLVLGLILSGPVFIFTFIFTFIQSPIFERTYLQMRRVVEWASLTKKQYSNSSNLG
ncbi:MAG TPA: YitT family protein [Lentibacillus sp.]|uniref:YczE/YyaS/YitT family protein n=1 Tax=Lentibacillus sp. TaxID=1925746 RepID=UPI002B4AAED7|nr:YitT family protein [Lentibacillus sp.]HLR60899.1 YitT family protein [Lentibacillus sp.]